MEGVSDTTVRWVRGRPAPYSRRIGILFVCTGNTCRSPMAEALARHRLRAAGVDAVPVSSAGTLGWSGRPATDKALEVLAEHGVELPDHVSTKLDTDTVRSADLIVVMTRVHGWAVTAHDEEAAARTFLPDELIRLSASAGSPATGEAVRDWAERVGAQRAPGPLGHARDEIADPAGEALDVYRAVAGRLHRFTERLVETLVPG